MRQEWRVFFDAVVSRQAIRKVGLFELLLYADCTEGVNRRAS